MSPKLLCSEKTTVSERWCTSVTVPVQYCLALAYWGSLRNQWTPGANVNWGQREGQQSDCRTSPDPPSRQSIKQNYDGQLRTAHSNLNLVRNWRILTSFEVWKREHLLWTWLKWSCCNWTKTYSSDRWCPTTRGEQFAQWKTIRTGPFLLGSYCTEWVIHPWSWIPLWCNHQWWCVKMTRVAILFLLIQVHGHYLIFVCDILSLDSRPWVIGEYSPRQS